MTEGIRNKHGPEVEDELAVKINNIKMELISFEKIQQKTLKEIQKKNTKTLVAAISVCFIVTLILIMMIPVVASEKNNGQPLEERFVIQDLRGDNIKTFMPWHLVQGQTLNVNIMNSKLISSEKVNVIRDAILSDKEIILDDSLLHKGLPGSKSTYYLGWKGALEKASDHSTALYIPTNFKIVESPIGGDIIIKLTTDIDPDGLNAETRSITYGNQILMNTITIYGADRLLDGELSTIVRHEFGHALGLGHSTAPEDLMHNTIRTDYPFISECDIDAIVALYDGKSLSKIVCEK